MSVTISDVDEELAHLSARARELAAERASLEQRLSTALADLEDTRRHAALDERRRSSLPAKHAALEKLNRQFADVAGMAAAVDVAIKEAREAKAQTEEAEKWRRISERAAVLEARRADIVECVRELEARYDAAAEVYREVLQLGGSPRALGDIVIFGLSLAQLMGSSGWEMNRFG